MMTFKLYHSSIEELADTVTPVTAYLNLRDKYPDVLLLESSDYHSAEDSFSFICVSSLASFEATEEQVRLRYPDRTGGVLKDVDPGSVWQAFRDFLCAFETDAGEPFRKYCGAYGYNTYESVQYFEDIRLNSPRPSAKRIPDINYRVFEYIIVFDHFKNRLLINRFGLSPESASAGLNRIRSTIRLNRVSQFSFAADVGESSTIEDNTYRAMVQRGIDHCQRGDVFQVVLSREFSRRYKGDEFNVYRALRSLNPSPYLFFFDYGDFKLFGSSPESQLKVHGNKAYINPIAGTVRRSGDGATDLERANALKTDPKENSEHIMLVDLARNDLSRSAHHVTVETMAELQYFSHVIHMVSKVSGVLNGRGDSLDVFADTFPAGTLSGAPKYRAMEIIDENETHARGFYGGSLGFFGIDGSVNQAIMIRSVLCIRNTLYYQAGAGIVVSSNPESELQEVNNKLAAIRQAIQKAEEL